MVEPGASVQVDRYDAMFDGDFTTIYSVTYADRGGGPVTGEVTIGKGGPSRRWYAPRRA